MTREEAIEKIKFLSDHSCNYYLGRENAIALDMALEALKQPEQKKGKWINCGTVWDGIDEYTMFRCSECIQPNYKMSRFCPNCGAKMEE